LKGKKVADHNFDGISQKFIKNIYGTTKGQIRAEIVWQALLDCLALLPKEKKLRVLDAGGGFGFFSQKLAALGHEVILCDISGELLTEARKQIQGTSFEKKITLHHCSIQTLSEHTKGPFDLILNHAVLEWLDDPKSVLKILTEYLSTDGVLSLMFYNKEAQRFHNLVSGNFDFVERGMVRKKVVRLTPTTPLFERDVKEWIEELKLQIIQKTGVRVLHDYLKEREITEQKFDQLLAMEKQYCQQEPYASLGRYIHFSVMMK
jgi:S-adenosylmethionine-dependent methyltransferase